MGADPHVREAVINRTSSGDVGGDEVDLNAGGNAAPRGSQEDARSRTGSQMSATETRQARAPSLRGEGDLHVEVLTHVDALAGIAGEWAALHAESGSRNPFLTPEWQVAWARHFTSPGDLRVVAVRRGARLAAVAPFYRHVTRVGPFRAVSRLRLIGRGKTDLLTELPQVLADPAVQRKVLRAAIGELTASRPRPDWIEIALGPEQGWIEPEWLAGGPTRPRWVSLHSGVAATVVMRLPETSDELARQLKRNVTESIRRSKNRLRRAAADWRFEVVAEPGPRLDSALARLVALHGARADAEDRPTHSDYFASGDLGPFLREAGPAMAAAGRAKVASIVVDGAAIASVLVLRANGCAFLSASGMDPRWWEQGPMTLLIRECLGDAIESGDRYVNLSRGPNASKLRWSEELEVHHHFNLVAGTPRSRRVFALYAPWRTLAEFRMRAR